MATLVAFHAHPDDEALATGGVMAKAADDGHRVVLVVATRGEHGEVPLDLAPDESLAQRRTAETHRAAEILGVARVEFLGYHDSGMAGTAENHAPTSFWSADVDEAAARLAAVLLEEQAHVLTVYDANGVYGHPDHVQVHRVGIRAAQLAATPRVYEATLDRDYVIGQMRAHPAELRAELGAPDPDTFDMGVTSAEVTTTVDVRAVIDRKRAAIAAHASQVSPESFFLALPTDAFRESFGFEWFIRHGPRPSGHETSLFDGLA